MKKSKVHKEAHVSNTKIGSGDYYGTGIKQPVGKLRDDFIIKAIKPKGLSKPPKSLA